jgi:hypothetical protein
MNISDVQQIGKEVIGLLARYHNPPHKELLVDAILFAYLTGRYSKVRRQFPVYLYGSKKPQRIDFRFGGSNPVVLELAVRRPTGGGSLYGSQNESELRKLCRVSHTQARLRVLLLLDLANKSLSKAALRRTYDPLHAGQGKFRRSAVRVIYVHHSETFHFRWSPFKTG